MSTIKVNAIQHSGGSNTALALSSNGQVVFPNTAIFSGSVGIGTTAPAYKLDVQNNTNGLARFMFSNSDTTTWQQTDLAIGRGGSSDLYIGTNYLNTRQSFIDDRSGGYLSFKYSGTETMRIDSSGCVTKPYQPAFVAYMSGNQTTTSGGQLLFDTLSNEIPSIRSSGYSTTNKRYTAPVTGLYQFSVSLDFGGAYSAYYFWCGINGASRNRDFLENITIGASGGVYSTFCMYMNSGDYIQLHAGNAGLLLYGGNAAYNCVWQGHLIG